MNNIDKISLIITTYNRSKNIIKIIKLINKQLNLYNKIEILICDSNSKDKLKILNHIKNYNSLDIRYVNLKKNNQAYKRNIGAKVSKGEYIIFLDDDCFPESNFLFNFYKKLKLKRKRDIYCGTVQYIKKSNIKNLIKFRDDRSLKYKNSSKKILVKNFVTMNMGLNKKNFSNYEKFFDKRFNFYGFEDFELAYRLEKRGYNIELISSKIFHKDFRSFKIWLKRFQYMGEFGIHDICKININAARKSVFYKIYKNKFLISFFKIPKIIIILDYLEKLIIFIEGKMLFYLPLLYKGGMFISYIKGLYIKFNKKKEFKSYKNSLTNWYE